MPSSTSPTLLGLDVHKNTISAGILRPGEDVPDVEKISSDPDAVRRLITRLGNSRRLRACYEAGPTGYELARMLEAGDEPVPAGLIEPFGRHQQHPTDPVQRVASPAPMLQGVVLDPAAHGIDRPVGQGDGVEVVHDQHGLGQLDGDGVGVTPEGVSGGHDDLVPPLLGPPGQPVGHDPAGTAGHHIDQLGPVQVDQPGHIGRAPVSGRVQERRLIDA